MNILGRRRRARILDIKEAVRERDGCRCSRCGMTQEEHLSAFGRRLDVHRLEPGEAYTVEGCVALCRPCHRLMPKSPHRSYPSGYRLRLGRNDWSRLKLVCDVFHDKVSEYVNRVLRAEIEQDWPKALKKLDAGTSPDSPAKPQR